MAIYVRTYDSEQLSVSADTKLSNLNAGDVLAWDPVKNAWVNSAPPVTDEAIKDLIAGTVQAGPGTENLKITTSYNDVTGKLSIDLTQLSPFGIGASYASGAVSQVKNLNFDGSGVNSVSINGDTATITIAGGASGDGGLAAVGLQSGGVPIGNITSLDFTGAGVTVDGTTGRVVIDPANKIGRAHV